MTPREPQTPLEGREMISVPPDKDDSAGLGPLLRVARSACLAWLVAIYIIMRRFGPQGSPQLSRLHLAFFS